MSEDADFLEPENLPELPKTLGIRMLEGDSIDVFVDGLRMAGEGSMHLHYWRDDRDEELWLDASRHFDKLRIAFAKLARSKSSDQQETRDPGDSKVPQIDCYERVFNGLANASRAARQIASGHRGDLRWSAAANQLDRWRDRMSGLVRKRKIQAAAPSILLPN